MKSQKAWQKRQPSGLAIAMSILFPRIPLSRWPAMIGITFLGASMAGLYGIVHDQVTFSISQEYFTRLKFTQFQWANIGLPTRVFVAEIGFLATWWVGLIAGWVLARTSAEAVEPRVMLRLSVRGFALVIGCALAAAVIAFVYGLMQDVKLEASDLADFARAIGVSDVPSFVRVAYIHNAGYLGSFLGIVAAATLLWRKRRSSSG